MKFYKILALAAAVTAGASAFADMDNVMLTFSTKGPDKYADGSVVADGEFYALVWIARPAVAVGIEADGKAVGLDAAGNKIESGTKVLAVKSLAENGACKEYTFQIVAEYAKSKLTDGEYALVLLDTRKADGTPSVKGDSFDKANGRVNGYSKITDCTIAVQPGSQLVVAGKSAEESQTAALASLIPDYIENPVITGIKIDGDKVILTVSGTSTKLDYGVAAAATP